MQIKNYFILLVAVILIFVFVVQRDQEVPVENKQVDSVQQVSNTVAGVKIGGKIVEVEVVQTPEEMSRGLSGRDGLAEDAGMLFVFSQPGRYSFWMKDMNFPIDIIWLAPPDGAEQDLRVVYIEKNARPESFPETFGPDAEAQYVLEVVAGFSEKHNLQVGDRVEFLYQQ